MRVEIINHQPDVGNIYERAVEKWGVSFERGATFTFGNKIFCVSTPPDDLMEHETVHVSQQTNYPGGPQAWWDRYFENDEFRLDQELKAYRRQYHWAQGNLKDRTDIFRILEHCAKSLCGPIYGNLVTFQEAMDLIKGVQHVS